MRSPLSTFAASARAFTVHACACCADGSVRDTAALTNQLASLRSTYRSIDRLIDRLPPPSPPPSLLPPPLPTTMPPPLPPLPPLPLPSTPAAAATNAADAAAAAAAFISLVADADAAVATATLLPGIWVVLLPFANDATCSGAATSIAVAGQLSDSLEVALLLSLVGRYRLCTSDLAARDAIRVRTHWS